MYLYKYEYTISCYGIENRQVIYPVVVEDYMVPQAGILQPSQWISLLPGVSALDIPQKPTKTRTQR
jgi:hypothetical protein